MSQQDTDGGMDDRIDRPVLLNEPPPANIDIFMSMTPEQVEMELMRMNEDIKPNHIILLTVLNAQYPINVSIINKVCSVVGKVLRIVVFKRGNIIQAMVE